MAYTGGTTLHASRLLVVFLLFHIPSTVISEATSLPFTSANFLDHKSDRIQLSNFTNAAKLQSSPSKLGGKEMTTLDFADRDSLKSSSEVIQSPKSSTKTTYQQSTPVVSSQEETTTLGSVDVLGSESNAQRMFLCDHPPNLYDPSAGFLGHAGDLCETYEKLKYLEFTHTLELCKYLYSIVFYDVEPFDFVSYYMEGIYFDIYYDENFVKICLPWVRRFESCEEREYLTICEEIQVVFFHSYNCSQSSQDPFLAAYLLQNDTECFKQVCEGYLSLETLEINGVSVLMFNTLFKGNTSSCGYITDYSLRSFTDSYNDTIYITINVHWPCCYSLYVVLWAGLPEQYGLNGDWSYLPLPCKASEVLLIVIVVCVTVGGLLGNSLVVVVMACGGHRQQVSSMLRTSLAIADLLTSVFVVTPSLYHHLVPFFFPPEYLELSPDEILVNDPVNITNSIHVAHYFHSQSGFLLFQSIVFCVSSVVSLLTMFVLSLERYVIMGRTLHYKDYFTVQWTKLTITISWVMSFVSALVFAAHYDGHLSSLRMTFSKLPTGETGEYRSNVVDFVYYHSQILIFLTAGVSTVIFSLLAIKNFVQEQVRVRVEWRNLNMRTTSQFEKENRHILLTMLLMLVLFLVSCVPLAINVVLQSLDYVYRGHHVYSYFSWWLFLARSAWNPWIYNMRSQQFKSDVAETLQKVMPKRLRGKLQRWVTHPQRRPSDNQDKLDDLMEKFRPKES